MMRMGGIGIVVLLGLLQACTGAETDRPSVARLTESVIAVGNDRAAIASGFIVEGGWLLTNDHVSRSGPLYIVHADGSRTLLVRQFSDPTNDIAVYASEASLPTLSLSTQEPSVGETVLALGNPLGLGITATRGIVSALPKTIGKANLLQTDAAINPGNSGGPLLNDSGHVVGMVTSRGAVGSGIGFAVPAAFLRRVIDDLSGT